MRILLILSIALLLGACKSATEPKEKKIQVVTEAGSSDKDKTTAAEFVPTVQKTQAEWKAQLTEMEYYVLREEGTERSFTSPLLNEKRKGTFICKGCNNPLFASETKYKSGTGWPSFYQPINDESLNKDVDHKIGYARTEVECKRCGGHLGHVFEDGPEPTGLRYCINGVALDFKPAK